MILKRLTFFSMVMLFVALFSSQAFAAFTVPYFGSDTEKTFWADQIYHDDMIQSLTIDGQGQGEILVVDAGGATMSTIPVTVNGQQTLNINGAGFTFKANSGKFWAVYATTSNYLSSEVVFDTPGSTNTTTGKVRITSKEYLPGDDVYRITYTGWPSNTAKYQLHFLSPTGEHFTSDMYNFNPTGIHYLTCNGTYWLEFYDASGTKIAETDKTQTSEIVNPACSSYPETTGNGESSAGSGADTGTQTGTDPGTGNGCTTCQKLDETLKCPQWDEMMGDFTQAVKNAIEWDKGAKAFSKEFEQMLGHPEPPPPLGYPSPPTFDGTAGVNRPDSPIDATPPAQSFDDDIANIPSVPIEQDNTGGIDLRPADPIDGMPHDDENYMPKPGQETGGDKPMQKPIETPLPNNGEVSPPDEQTPQPGTSTGENPIPTAPSPGGEVTPPPKPEMPLIE